MKIATLQFAPSPLVPVSQNIAKATTILNSTTSPTPGSIDLLILPELAFTGYTHTLESITPHLEPTTSGTSSIWGKETARRLQCHVAVGYPERTSEGRNFNSLVVVDRNGDVVANYRKSFLYYTDEAWAEEGDGGFFFGELGLGGLGHGDRKSRGGSELPSESDEMVKVAMGICMDINPYKFEAPWGKCEFASHCVAKGAELVVLSMAWLTSLMPEELKDSKAAQPDLETLSYWIERFKPLVDLEAKRDGDEGVIVVLANRCGTEFGNVNGIVRARDEEGQAVVGYAGTSCVLKIKDGKVQIFDILGRGEERLLIIDTEQEPRFQLARRRSTKAGE